MGMYTGLKFEAKLKPIVADAMNLVYSKESSDGFWGSLSRIIPVSDEWLVTDRRDFIPFGALSYMPSEWDDVPTGIEGDTWRVCCSLKNYQGEIGQFLAEVLPYLISEPCRAEVLYEEWEESKFEDIIPKEYEEEN
jgi:hypothetical protein